METGADSRSAEIRIYICRVQRAGIAAAEMKNRPEER